MRCSRRGRSCWSRKRRRGSLVSSRCSQSPHDKAVVARCAQSGTNQATPKMDEEKNSVSFRFPSPPHRLSFFAPSAESPRNSSRQTCRRPTKEILSPRRASVPSATGTRLERRKALVGCAQWGISQPTLKRAEEKSSGRFCFPSPPDRTNFPAPPVKSSQNSFTRAWEETKRDPRFLMHR